MPPAFGIAGDLPGLVGRGAKPAQLTVHRRASTPLLELQGSQTAPQPSVHIAHDLPRLRQPEVRLPARHVRAQVLCHLGQALTPRALRDLPQPPKFDSFTPRATPELNPDKHLAAY